MRVEGYMQKFVKNYKKYQFLLRELIKKDIKLKYRNSVLGLFWTMLEPLLTMLVLTFIFGNLLGKGEDNFPVYILIGRLLYSFFSNGTKLALKSIRKNSGMIRKVYVPKYMYPLASSVSGFVTFLVSLLVLVGVAIVQRVEPTVYLFQLIFPLGAILLMTTGVGMILATLAVFFRDLEYLWSVFLMLIMYTCAIFYRVEPIVEKGHGWIFKINPLYSVIYNFRNAVFGKPMDNYHFMFASVFSIAVLIIGAGIFYWKQDKFILYV